MEEMFDIYTRDGKYLGTKEKSICHGPNPGFYHKPAIMWIVNDNKEILVQKRAACKKSHPNMWDLGCAGHIDAGETPVEGAIREAKEELGIDTKKEDYEFMFEYIFDETWEITVTFLVRLNAKIEDFKIKKDELSEVKWVNYEDFEELVYSDNFVPYKEYIGVMMPKLKEILK